MTRRISFEDKSFSYRGIVGVGLLATSKEDGHTEDVPQWWLSRPEEVEDVNRLYKRAFGDTCYKNMLIEEIEKEEKKR